MTAKKLHRYLQLLFLAGFAFSFFIVKYAVGWLTESSKELSSLRTEVIGLENKQTELEKAKKILNDRTDDVATASQVLPADKEQARVVQEIYAIASQSNVSIDSVGFPSSTLGSTAAPKPATTTTTDPTATASTVTTDAPKPVKTVSQATPVKEIPGVQSIELSIGTITSKDTSIKGVRYEEMMTLIRLIERNRRTMQIRSIGIGQSQTINGNPTYNLTLSIVIYIQP